MSDETKGKWSKNLLSLQLQIKTLLEEAGGDQAVELLDTLANLSVTEQRIALRMFKRVLQKIITGHARITSASEQELKQWEESLYTDLLASFQEIMSDTINRKLVVLDGGVRRRKARASRSNIARLGVIEGTKGAQAADCKPSVN